MEASTTTRVHVQRGTSGAGRVGIAEDTEETIVQLPRAARVRPWLLRFEEELLERGNAAESQVERQTGGGDRPSATVHVPILRRIVEETPAPTVHRDRDRFQRHNEADLGQESRGGFPGKEQQRKDGGQQKLRAEFRCYVERVQEGI